MIPPELNYVDTHEWIRDEGDGSVTIGITEHAQEALGDVVFVELPEVGRELSAGDDFGVVESVKAASDLYSPLSGEILDVNGSLEDSPETINEAPYKAGWLIKLRLSDKGELADLLDAEAYAKVVEADA